MGWKFWKHGHKPDVAITAVICRIENKDLHNFLQIKKQYVHSTGFDLIAYTQSKANRNAEIIGGSRLGKTSLGEYNCIKLPQRKIIVSFKKFQLKIRDFDFGYNWTDVSQHLPNFWEDSQSAIEAFGTAFFAEANSRGLMIDTIKSRYAEVMRQKPQSFSEFFEKLNKVAKGNWENNIANLVESKVRLLEEATKNAKTGSIDFRKGDIVLDFGNLADEEVKTFFAEYYLRQIARIEEQEQREKKLYIVIDEAWHLLQAKQQKSIIGNLLLQGAYFIHLIIITQNFCHLDKDYRGHFGSVFCFRNSNDEDMKAIEGAHGAYVRDGVRLLSDFEFMDLKYEHGEGVIPVWKLNYDNLENAKLEARFCSEPDESFTEEEQKEEAKKEKETANEIESRVIEVLTKSDFCMYYSEIATALGYPKNSMERLGIVNILKRLVKEEKIREKLYVTSTLKAGQKPRRYYFSIPNGESQLHRTMLKDCEVILKKTNAKYELGFINQGVDIICDGFDIECETSLKKSLAEYDQKTNASDKFVITVVCNEQDRERYSYLSCVEAGKTKIVLLNELADTVKELEK
ncbi:MAG: ATP-binding protein [Nitrosotalea sp.]